MSSQTFFFKKGETSKSVLLALVQDAAATSPGDELTGLVYNSAGLTAYYKINGTGTATAITLATQTATGAYSSGGFVAVDATNMPGTYRLDLPDAVLASTGIVMITIKGATNLATHNVLLVVESDAPDNALNDEVMTFAAIANGTITLASGHGITNTTIAVELTGGTNAVGKSRIATYSGTGDVYNVDPAWNGTVNGVTETLPSGTLTGNIYAVPPGPQSAANLPSASMDAILNTALTETTATRLATSFKTLFDNGDAASTATLSNITDILTDTGTTLPASIATIDANVDTTVSGVITGAAVTGTLSTTVATTDLTGYADDQLTGRVIIWTSGNCDGEATDITDYASLNGTLTFTALTTAPANTDTFKIV